ncbi:hypothetical protein D3C72_1923920 [compost metagenome]
MGRELDRDTAGVANAVAQALGEVEMVAVAGIEVAARLGDADDRLAGAQLFRCRAVVHEALEIERGQIDVVGIVEPVLRAQASAGLVFFAHWFSSRWR